MSTSVCVFAKMNPISYSHLLDLCRDPEELRIYFFKSGLLGDRSGICEYCNLGNVNLTKKEGLFYWKCGARACKKKQNQSPFGRVHFLNDQLDFKTILCLIYCWIYIMSLRKKGRSPHLKEKIFVPTKRTHPLHS